MTEYGPKRAPGMRISPTGTSTSKGKQRIPEDLQRWIDARKQFHLSHAHVQMARELGMNPKKLGGLANHTQEPWKRPLPEFIERLYARSFGRPQPERVVSIEERAKELARKKALRAEARATRRAGEQVPPSGAAIGEAGGHE